MSEIDLSTPIQSPPSIEVRITPEEVLASVQEARSGRALTALQRRYIDLGLIDIPTEEAIKQRRKEVRRQKSRLDLGKHLRLRRRRLVLISAIRSRGRISGRCSSRRHPGSRRRTQACRLFRER